MSRRLALAPLGLLCLLLALGGCVSLPHSGAVHTVQIQEQGDDEAPVDFTPGGPTPGAEPVEIVRGFLVAMQATPLSTSVARRFLTAESGSSWVPERGTVVYDAESRTATKGGVRLELEGVVRLDQRGTWLGERGDASYDLTLVKEKGEWRISDPPDLLIIPYTHFETRFEQHFLYFLDKSGQVLVPEPVYVPTGPQATTSLVSGLLAGPDRDLLGVERTYLPAGTTLDDISVPVSQEGVAQVPLSDEVLDLDQQQLSLAFGQLAWTLAQVPGVERMRVTVDGSPLDLASGETDVDVDGWSTLSPSVAWASESLFGLRDGRVTNIVAGDERRVTGPFGASDYGLDLIAVDLPGKRVAGTTEDGRVLVAPRSSDLGTPAKASSVSTVLEGGTDLAKPAWDLYGRLWVVDRTSAGAVVTVIGKGGTQQVDVPGITGREVRSFVLSRDGTRLVAEVDSGTRDRLLVSRVLRENTGAVRRLSRADEIPLRKLGVREVTDIAWRTPGTLAVLTAPSSDTAAVLIVRIDGSSTPTDAGAGAETLLERARQVVSAPLLASPMFLRTPDGRLFALASNGRWVRASIPAGLRSPTFVG